MIEILNFQMVDKGSLVARFNAKFHKMGGLILDGWTLFISGDKKWVNPPSKEYEQDGKKKYKSYARFEDRDVTDRFKHAVLVAALEKMEFERKLKEGAPAPSNDYKDDDFPF